MSNSDSKTVPVQFWLSRKEKNILVSASTLESLSLSSFCRVNLLKASKSILKEGKD